MVRVRQVWLTAAAMVVAVSWMATSATAGIPAADTCTLIMRGTALAADSGGAGTPAEAAAVVTRLYGLEHLDPAVEIEANLVPEPFDGTVRVVALPDGTWVAQSWTLCLDTAQPLADLDPVGGS